MTTLAVTSCQDNEEAVKLLLQHPDILVNSQASDDGLTALMFAAQQGNAASALVLLNDDRIDPNLHDKVGQTLSDNDCLSDIHCRTTRTPHSSGLLSSVKQKC